MIKNCSKQLLTITLCFTAFIKLFTSPIYAVDSLGNLRDIINTDELNVEAEHSVSFTLPTNSQQINSTDYIRITLPSFSNVTAPSLVSGNYGGTPSFSVDGNTAIVTGITVTPGARVTINGITANNPGVINGFGFYVIVSEDEDGDIIKNFANGTANESGSEVSVTASIDTPQASLLISGYTAPNSFVIFTENDAVIGTDVSSSLGYFAQNFSGLTPATHNVTLYSIDSSDLTTSPIPLEIYTPVYQQTTVSNLLLSPSIQISDAQILQGDDLIATGSARPGGDITLFTESPLRTYYASAAASGAWDYTIDNTSDYTLGDYQIYALVQDSIGAQSLTSPTLAFSVVSSSGSTGSACGNISQGDLNCDSSINLTDFSILMYYWSTADATADINNDGIVNLTDFSIMMYYWGT